MRSTWMRPAHLFVTCLVALTAFSRLSAQPTPPPDAVVWYRLDAGRIGASASVTPQLTAIQNLARVIGASRIIQDDAAEQTFESLIAQAIADAADHTFAVWDVREDPGASAPSAKPGVTAFNGVRYTAVISITEPDHTRLLQLLQRSIGTDEATAGEPPTRQPIEIIGRRPATVWNRRGVPSWRRIAWCESGSTLVVGIGPDSIERWFQLQDARADARLTPWFPHVRWVAQDHPAGPVIGEFFINLDRLRHAFEERFDDDAAARLLNLFHLANARSFMLHLRAASGLLAPGVPAERGVPAVLDASWSPRSEKPGSVHRMALSEPLWPAGELDDETAAPGIHLILKPALIGVIQRSLDAYAATLSGRDLAEFNRARRAWLAKRLPAISRVADALEPHVVVTIDPASTGAGVSSIEIHAFIKPKSRGETVAKDLSSLAEPLADRVSSDAGAQTWWLRQPGWVVPATTWGVAGRKVVIGLDLGSGSDWSWTAVSRVRDRK